MGFEVGDVVVLRHSLHQIKAGDPIVLSQDATLPVMIDHFIPHGTAGVIKKVLRGQGDVPDLCEVAFPEARDVAFVTVASLEIAERN